MSAPGEHFQGPSAVYDRFVGRYSRALAQQMIRAAGVAEGMRALDVGCGPGPLTRELAEVVGAESVAAVDPSEPFVEACRARVPGADVQVATAESLPFEDDAFDAVLSQLVVNFLQDAPQGVAEMRRVAKPAGVIAACVWDYAGEMTLLRAYWDSARSLDPDASDEGVTMRFAQPDELGELWRGAGLSDVVVTPLVVEAAYDDFDDLWSPFPTGVGPAGAYAASLDAQAQERLRVEYRLRLGDPTGPFTLSARAWCAVGRNG
jgi:SAM-dependent methyltransferase